MIAIWIDVILLIVFVLILIFLIEILFGLFICLLFGFISPRIFFTAFSLAISSVLLLAFYFWHLILTLTLAFLAYKIVISKLLSSLITKINMVNNGTFENKQTTSALNFDEFTTCQICYEDFDLEKRTPLLLKCKFIFSL